MRAAIFIFLALQPSTLKQLMLDRIHPASNGILLTAFRGAPLTDKDWTSLQQNAATLEDAATHLANQGAPAPSEWNKAAVELSTAASDTASAAQLKDPKPLPAIATRIDATCTNCHKHYRPNVFPQQGLK